MQVVHYPPLSMLYFKLQKHIYNTRHPSWFDVKKKEIQELSNKYSFDDFGNSNSNYSFGDYSQIVY